MTVTSSSANAVCRTMSLSLRALAIEHPALAGCAHRGASPYRQGQKHRTTGTCGEDGHRKRRDRFHGTSGQEQRHGERNQHGAEQRNEHRQSHPHPLHALDTVPQNR